MLSKVSAVDIAGGVLWTTIFCRGWYEFSHNMVSESAAGSGWMLQAVSLFGAVYCWSRVLGARKG